MSKFEELVLAVARTVTDPKVRELLLEVEKEYENDLYNVLVAK